MPNEPRKIQHEIDGWMNEWQLQQLFTGSWNCLLIMEIVSFVDSKRVNYHSRAVTMQFNDTWQAEWS